MGSIVVNKIGKAFKQYPNKWSRLIEWLVFGKKKKHALKWVMKDISFKVEPGEAVGIIGINGAGKSTLLKIITGTSLPTEGTVEISGRVAALLELGMGFHPDFTGRQNVYMSGQLLGMNTKEIEDLLPAILEFSEIGPYIDKPVRVYSSGMQMRLAFSLATATRPDVLIVDEALSVGDVYFQHKSFQRIRDYRNKGTTLLIVSHDKSAIQSICDKALLLNGGKLEMLGKPDEVFDYYNALLSDRKGETIERVNVDGDSICTSSGSRKAKFTETMLLNELNERIELVGVGDTITLQMKAKCEEEIPELVFGYVIKDRFGQEIFGENTQSRGLSIEHAKPNQEVIVRFSIDMNVGVGHYSISVALAAGSSHIDGNYEWKDRTVVFEVRNSTKKDFIGSSWLRTDVTREQ